MNACSTEFFEYYLESGQAILLFDGLDELPGPQFKRTVKNRINSFLVTYPGNTAIITSRIVGYEAEVRFDNTFSHYRVAKLRISEIERFIHDWYAARLEEDAEQKANAKDLIRVITNPDNDAIRDLARNPLLLTIVALVHRIDAVLPDERVVLYQKCTETLLNTWYRAKRKDDEPIRGRIERRNRLRIEAIAYWMHCRSLGNQERSVVPYSELHQFLTDYIRTSERLRDEDDDPQDQAEDFLRFIRSTAGLLIEAGDGHYSFIHLTFQEYLSATHLVGFGESGGTQSIWDELHGDIANPRWREVVRLLVASLRSTTGQSFFIEKLLAQFGNTLSRDAALLLLGLLRDGIEPAEDRSEEIISKSTHAIIALAESNDIRLIVDALLAWKGKQETNGRLLTTCMKSIASRLRGSDKCTLALIAAMLKIDPGDLDYSVTSAAFPSKSSKRAFEALILERRFKRAVPDTWRGLLALHDLWATHSPEGNAAAAIGLAISVLLDPVKPAKRLLRREILLLATVGYGPHRDHLLNLLGIGLSANIRSPFLEKAISSSLGVSHDGGRKRKPSARMLLPQILDVFMAERTTSSGPSEFLMTDALRDRLSAKLSSVGVPSMEPDLTATDRTQSQLSMLRKSFRPQQARSPELYWNMLRSTDVFAEHLIDSLGTTLHLQPMEHWREALRTVLPARVPYSVGQYLVPEEWARVEKTLDTGSASEEDLDLAAWLLLVDLWVWDNRGYRYASDSPFERVSAISRTYKYPALLLANTVRDVCQERHDHGSDFRTLVFDETTGVLRLLRDNCWPEPLSLRGEKFRRPNDRPSSKGKVPSAETVGGGDHLGRGED